MNDITEKPTTIVIVRYKDDELTKSFVSASKATEYALSHRTTHPDTNEFPTDIIYLSLSAGEYHWNFTHKGWERKTFDSGLIFNWGDRFK
jgi:hypothetical protein